jgi:hypothetical protein
MRGDKENIRKSSNTSDSHLTRVGDSCLSKRLIMTLAPLPPYPSSDAQSKLPASQRASLNQKISLAIQKTLDLPVQTLNSEATVAFISSYARDVAQNILDALIWDAHSKTNPKAETNDSRNIRCSHFPPRRAARFERARWIS